MVEQALKIGLPLGEPKGFPPMSGQAVQSSGLGEKAALVPADAASAKKIMKIAEGATARSKAMRSAAALLNPRIIFRPSRSVVSFSTVDATSDAMTLTGSTRMPRRCASLIFDMQGRLKLPDTVRSS